jgi:hypothetical protein
MAKDSALAGVEGCSHSHQHTQGRATLLAPPAKAVSFLEWLARY